MLVKDNAPYLALVAPCILGAITIFSLVGVRFGEPPWSQEASEQILAVYAAAAFVLGLLLLHIRKFSDMISTVRILKIIIIGTLS